MNYWDRQYNPRLAVADPERYFASWRTRAALARANHAGHAELRYGAHERERLDVFHSPAARGTLVFLHGGYWRAFGKEDFSWIAVPFVQAGISVVVASYPLCPHASLAAISSSIAAALGYLGAEVLLPAERRRLVLAGHSAGAHLAAQNLAQPGVHAFVGISGIYDLQPLLHAPFLSAMGWDAAGLHAMSPLYASAPGACRIVLAVGGAESHEFHRQSQRLAEAWAPPCEGVLTVPGMNHFDVLESLCESGSALSDRTLGLFDPFFSIHNGR